MNRKLLEKYLEKGLTQQEIAKIVGKAKSTIGYWITKYGLNDKSNIKNLNIKTKKCLIKLILQKKLILLAML